MDPEARRIKAVITSQEIDAEGVDKAICPRSVAGDK